MKTPADLVNENGFVVMTQGDIEYRDFTVQIAVLEEVGCAWKETGWREDCDNTVSTTRKVCKRCAKLRELKGEK